MEEKIDINLYPNRHGTKLTLGLHIITKRRLGLCMPNI